MFFLPSYPPTHSPRPVDQTLSTTVALTLWWSLTGFFFGGGAGGNCLFLRNGDDDQHLIYKQTKKQTYQQINCRQRYLTLEARERRPALQRLLISRGSFGGLFEKRHLAPKQTPREPPPPPPPHPCSPCSPDAFTTELLPPIS